MCLPSVLVRLPGTGPFGLLMSAAWSSYYAECAERDCSAVIPLRKNQGERDVRIPRGSDKWRRLYRRRSAVEREFGNLKHNLGLAALRVRGIERSVARDLVMLGRLSVALARARTVPNAA